MLTTEHFQMIGGENLDSTHDVYFVYLGKSLPRYAQASLEIASQTSGLGVHLLGNANFGPLLKRKHIKFTAIEDFYDSGEFAFASKRLMYSHSFRNGFWLKSLERLFVLEQYMVSRQMIQIFHAELDQLLFGAHLLVSKLDDLDERGIFVPFQNRNAAIASVLYCNSREAFRSLLEYSCQIGMFSNEMALIANWAKQNSHCVFPLPTMASLILGEDTQISPALRTLHSDQIGGVVDAAQLGQWIGGVDPRNTPIFERPNTKFVADAEDMLLTREQLSTLKFDLDLKNFVLTCQYGAKLSVTVFNLHIHSKIHSWLAESNTNLNQLIEQANKLDSSIIPGARRLQLLHFVKHGSNTLITRPHVASSFAQGHFNQILKRRPTSKPFISGDTFRAFADHVWENDNARLDVQSVKNGDIIFSESNALESLRIKVLDKLDVSVVLLLGNSDRNFTNADADLLTHRKLTSVHAQNLMEPFPNAEPLPIGLENAWRRKNGIVRRFLRSRKRGRERIFRIMWTFEVQTNPEIRSVAASSLSRLRFADHLGDLSPRRHRKALSMYAFVASPPGNGIDTHRTWEAMYLGCIPIVLRSNVTEFYESLGLPIWVVDSYDSVTSLTERDLAFKYEQMELKQASTALWYDFWATRIENKT